MFCCRKKYVFFKEFIESKRKVKDGEIGRNKSMKKLVMEGFVMYVRCLGFFFELQVINEIFYVKFGEYNQRIFLIGEWEEEEMQRVQVRSYCGSGEER